MNPIFKAFLKFCTTKNLFEYFRKFVKTCKLVWHFIIAWNILVKNYHRFYPLFGRMFNCFSLLIG